MRRVRAACGLLTASLLVGCAVGPDYTPPAAPTQRAYAAPGEATPRTVALGAAVRADWWTLLRSPAVDRLVADALAGSPTLPAAHARLGEVQQALVEAQSGLYPQADLNASVTRGKFAPTSFGLSPGAFPLPPNYNIFQFGPTASYSVDLFGGTSRVIGEQRALAAYQQDQLDAAYLTLTRDTTYVAVQLAAAGSELAAVSQILDIDRRSLGLIEAEREAGSVPDSDVVLARSQLAGDLALQPDLLQQQSAAVHALAVLTGRAPVDFTPPALDLSSLALPERLPVSLPSALVHRRPDIMAAEASLRAASEAVGVAAAQSYPSVTLTAAVGAAALDPGHLFSPAALVWSIAAGLSQPIFDAGLRRARREAALDAFRATAADYQQTVLQAFREVADRLQGLVHDRLLLDDEQQALDSATQSVQLQRINYAQGGTGILDLLEAQRLYQQALRGYVRAEAQRALDSVQLLAETAGGMTRLRGAPVGGRSSGPP